MERPMLDITKPTGPIESAVESDYIKYRGKCKQLSEELCKNDPTLILVRGWYYDPHWGEQMHWWYKREDGTIIDPTKDQFPSKGNGMYVEFNGYYECENCGNSVSEENMVPAGTHPMCSNKCAFEFVGLGDCYKGE